MNREIKFRAWDKEDGEWLYAEPIYGFFPSLPMSEEVKQSERYGDIQQFTGLLDAKGKEIYEGDIVEFYDGIGQIEMRNGAWMSTYNDPKDNAFNRPDLLHDILTNPHRDDGEGDAVVIGNVHENPELIRSLKGDE